ncbi:hypothetical protein [Rhizobium mongolense]|uniref:hypothetical protein n=1 Tax=Rhizobium mongolense TaxID=57676 RepID=UPI000A053BCD
MALFHGGERKISAALLALGRQAVADLLKQSDSAGKLIWCHRVAGAFLVLLHKPLEASLLRAPVQDRLFGFLTLLDAEAGAGAGLQRHSSPKRHTAVDLCMGRLHTFVDVVHRIDDVAFYKGGFQECL